MSKRIAPGPSGSHTLPLSEKPKVLAPVWIAGGKTSGPGLRIICPFFGHEEVRKGNEISVRRIKICFTLTWFYLLKSEFIFHVKTPLSNFQSITPRARGNK